MMFPQEIKKEFSRPVESIMMCEDFKSNFARRLSNRYIARSPATAKQDTSLKLPPGNAPENAPERIEPCSQLSKSVTELNGEAFKPVIKKTDNADFRSTEVSALNMEVETLRWQLSQTEANRQMHIALLKQIVSFLSRVKEHIECQKPEFSQRKETMSTRTPRSFNVADLPRSRSVVHVNKNVEYSLSPTKKISSRKISKSISNVNGCRDSSSNLSPSKLSLTSETESAQKITEEMSRLINLATTVLSTKLPDLSCTCNDFNPTLTVTQEEIHDKIKTDTNSTLPLNQIEEDKTNALILNSISNSEDAFRNNCLAAKEITVKEFILPSPLTCDNDLAKVKMIEKENSSKMECVKSHGLVEKRNEYNVANFIEDESGFSSMSSFQEIGIPIISIIPPSPCKEVGYIDEITDMLNESPKWKNDSMDLEKAVKVFWV